MKNLIAESFARRLKEAKSATKDHTADFVKNRFCDKLKNLNKRLL